MKKLSRISPAKYAVALLALTASIAYLALDAILPAKPAAPNKYQSAQRAVVSVKAETGEGSGYVIKRVNQFGQQRVFVWTAAHVVDGPKDHEVGIRQVIRHEAHKVGTTDFKGKLVMRSDRFVDLALLWVDAPPSYFDAVVFDTSEPVGLGEQLFHVGNYRGEVFDGSFATGVLAQHGAHAGAGWPWLPLDQTTVLIVPGSSGGPLFRESNGKIVGTVVGWGLMPGISFFVPVRTMASFAESKGFTWALYGNYCPPDRELLKHNALYIPAPAPVEIRIFSIDGLVPKG